MKNKKKNSNEDQEQSHREMASRGVTRPMGGQSGKEEDHGNQGHRKIRDEQCNEMLYMHHKQTLWVYWLLVILGVWMILAPLTFGYGTSTVGPAGGREVWLSLDARINAMIWSDIISGLLLVMFGWRSLMPNRPVSLWICCFIGIWLNLAPVVFWAPNAAAYINGTLVGVMVIALSVIIPGIPNIIMHRKTGSNMPSGWSFNPSSWPQRAILVFLAFISLVASRYLGAYQLGYIESAWDPFFGDSTRQVLESDLSETWPISDAAFGGFAYTLEFLVAWMGGTSRWRTMPWLVTFFGILVIPLGLVHILLVISQPVVVGAWCTLCLLVAAVMLPMISLTIAEVAAMGQYMIKTKRKGNHFWTVFWKGGEPEEYTGDERSPAMIELPDKPGKVLQASITGMSFPLSLLLATLIGVWLMFAPDAFGVGIEETAANINHLTGSLIIIVSVISMAEVLRRVRYVNILLGLIIAIVPWFLPDGGQNFLINGTLAGIFVILLSIPRGLIHESYGMWDKYIS